MQTMNPVRQQNLTRPHSAIGSVSSNHVNNRRRLSTILEQNQSNQSDDLSTSENRKSDPYTKSLTNLIPFDQASEIQSIPEQEPNLVELTPVESGEDMICPPRAASAMSRHSYSDPTDSVKMNQLMTRHPYYRLSWIPSCQVQQATKL